MSIVFPSSSPSFSSTPTEYFSAPSRTPSPLPATEKLSTQHPDLDLIAHLLDALLQNRNLPPTDLTSLYGDRDPVYPAALQGGLRSTQLELQERQNIEAFLGKVQECKKQIQKGDRPNWEALRESFYLFFFALQEKSPELASALDILMKGVEQKSHFSSKQIQDIETLLSQSEALLKKEACLLETARQILKNLESISLIYKMQGGQQLAGRIDHIIAPLKQQISLLSKTDS